MSSDLPSNTELKTKEEATEEALEFFDGDALARDTFLKKYAVQVPKSEAEVTEDGDNKKYVETTPADMWDRLAREAASVEEDSEKWEEEFREILDDFTAVPQGSIMYALGNDYYNSSCSNCFVIPTNDSLEAIFDTAKEMAKTYSYRGGVGTDISALRPRNAETHNAAKKSTGAVSFMDFYSHVTGLIGQKNRRGALMLTISDAHPDLYHPEGDMDFLNIKRDLDKVTNANISVRISDDFMEAVENDEEWTLSWERKDNEIYVGGKYLKDSEGPDMKIERSYPAQDIWDNIVESATESAEPGVLFWDRVREQSPADQYEEEGFKTTSTNPCSELPLSPYGACTLLSINLTNFVENPFSEDAEVQWEKLREVAHKSVRFLDNVKTLDAEKVPLEKQKERALQARRIGVGTHGLGDFLIKMGYKYDSDEAEEFCEKVYEKLRNFVYGGSIELAREKEPFPIFDKQKHMKSPFIQRLPYGHKQGIKNHGLRNIACLTMAPTGSVSLISQTSSGIEPIYRLRYTRRFRQEDGIEEYEVNHPLVDEYLEEKGIELDEDDDIKDVLPEEFVEVPDLNYVNRTELQGTIQDYIDHAISSTINLPNQGEETKEIVADSYMKAWKEGCKGYTVYVEGSREQSPLSSGEEEPTEITDKMKYKTDAKIWEFVEEDKGLKFYLTEGNDQVFINGYSVNGDQPEVIELGNALESMLKDEYDDQNRVDKYVNRSIDPIEKVGRLTSLALKAGLGEEAFYIFSQYQEELELAKELYKVFKHKKIENTETCPECDSTDLKYSEGCKTCLTCGWSKCSV